MAVENKKPLEIGDKVKIHKKSLPFKVVGISEGGHRVFLQPSAFENRSRHEHAIFWDCDDLVKINR